VRPRRAAGLSGRPLNAGVRGHGPLSICRRRRRRVRLGGGAVLWVAGYWLPPRPASPWVDYWRGSASACRGTMVSASMVNVGGVSVRCSLHMPIWLHFRHPGPFSLRGPRGSLRGSPCSAATACSGGVGRTVCAMASNYAFERAVRHKVPSSRVRRAAAQRGR